MAVWQTPAIILRHSTDREHDRLLSVLTPEFGRLRVRARGTKKSVSKLGGSLEPVMLVNLVLAKGRSIDQVTGSVIVDRFAPLRNDTVSLVAAQWLLELVERVTKPDQVDEEIFGLVKEYLSDMAGEVSLPAGQRWLRLYRRAWKLLAHQGFSPSYEECAGCHQPLTEPMVYHPARGFIHQSEASSGAIGVSLTTLQYLEGQTEGDSRSLFRELRQIVDSVIHQTLDRPLNSDKVLAAIMRLERLSA